MFATFRIPLVELRFALALVRLSKLPEVNASAPRDSGLCEVAVDQFHICAKFKLSIVFTAAAAVIPLNATPEAVPPVRLPQAPPWYASSLPVSLA